MNFLNKLGFNKPKIEAETKLEDNKQSETESPAKTITTPENNNHRQELVIENLSAKVEDLEKAINDLENSDLPLSGATFNTVFEKIMGCSPEVFKSGALIENADEQDALKHIFNVTQERLNAESDTKSFNLVKSIRGHWENSPVFAKMSIVSLLLFLKFSPLHAQSGDPQKGLKENKITAKTDTKKMAGGDTKEVSGSDLEDARLNNAAKIDVSNNFETASAKIPAAKVQDMEKAFNEFLNEINSKNFSKVVYADWSVPGSSDERPIKSGEFKSNFDLTKARIDAAIAVFKSTLSNHDFSKAKLSPEQITQLKAKNFKPQIFTSANGPEAGVTYISDLKNPSTGKNYTPSEVEKLKKADPKTYENLLEKNRYIHINLLAESDPEKTMKNIFANYDRAIIIFDDSPSMKDDKQHLIKDLDKNLKDYPHIKLQMGAFSDKLEYLHDVSSLSEVDEAIMQDADLGNDQEKIIASIISALEKQPDKSQDSQGKTILLAKTDEKMQDLFTDSITKVINLSEQKGIDIKIQITWHETGGNEETLIDIKDLKSIVAKQETIQYRGQSNGIKFRQDQIAKIMTESKNKPGHKDAKVIEELEKEIVNLQAQIKPFGIEKAKLQQLLAKNTPSTKNIPSGTPGKLKQALPEDLNPINN